MTNILIKRLIAGVLVLTTLSPTTAIVTEDPYLQRGNIIAPKGQGDVLSQEVVLVADRRLEALEIFLTGYDSPLANDAQTFIEVADKYELDWRLLPAIAGLESTFGHRIAPDTYNPFGWGGGYIEFASWAEAIKTVGKGLAEDYVTRGLVTPEQIMARYCPPNGSWARGIRYFMDELEEVNSTTAED